MKEPKFKHYFNIVNGIFIWDDKDMLEFKRRKLDGKRGYAIIDEEKENITPNQYAYYFGGIIRKECMVSDAFKGFSDRQIHQILFFDLRSTTKGVKMPDETTKLVTVSEDFGTYGKKAMTEYIEELIPWLISEYNIHARPASHYEYNKFYVETRNTKRK